MKGEVRFQERCGRCALFLTMLHTVPVVWITPVVGGTAPTAGLLAFGVASLLTYDKEGVALGLFALAPALIYGAIAWVSAWLLGKGLVRVRRPVRAGLLAVLIGVPLLAVYFPIFIALGHNSSSRADLIALTDNTFSARVLLGYWIVLHGMLVLLCAGSLLREGHPLVACFDRWRRPILVGASFAIVGALLFFGYPQLVCRPLAELGSASAQVCVAKAFPRDQHYWYQRAGQQGHLEAIAWLVAHTTDRDGELNWLRRGAERGDAEMQFALFERLLRWGGADEVAEAEQWLGLAAEANHAPAQMVLVDRLTREIHRSRSRDRLAERNAWLERAARLGSRTARLRLAGHYTDGSMGYPADLHEARDYYRGLVDDGEPPPRESALGLNVARFEESLAEVETWSDGLDNLDPTVTRAMAKRYLGSPFPGPGVRELGLELMEQLAANGDKKARDELIVMLRTGTGGVDKSSESAEAWLIKAAEAGDRDAMERLVRNYMSGQEGFDVDYPEARRWIEAQIEQARRGDGDSAQARMRNLQSQLSYIDRLGEHAGSDLLDSRDLEQLGQRTDAESSYRYARQLLAGHGSQRRAEAVARLEEAAGQGHGEAAWRLFQIYDRGFPREVDKDAALRMLRLAAANHQFDATRELAASYEYGKRGLPVDLPRAIALYEATLAAGHDNRYDWNLDPDNFNHFKWLESRLRQARLKLAAPVDSSGG